MGKRPTRPTLPQDWTPGSTPTLADFDASMRTYIGDLEVWADERDAALKTAIAATPLTGVLLDPMKLGRAAGVAADAFIATGFVKTGNRPAPEDFIASAAVLISMIRADGISAPGLVCVFAGVCAELRKADGKILSLKEDADSAIRDLEALQSEVTDQLESERAFTDAMERLRVAMVRALSLIDRGLGDVDPICEVDEHRHPITSAYLVLRSVIDPGAPNMRIPPSGGTSRISARVHARNGGALDGTDAKALEAKLMRAELDLAGANVELSTAVDFMIASGWDPTDGWPNEPAKPGPAHLLAWASKRVHDPVGDLRREVERIASAVYDDVDAFARALSGVLDGRLWTPSPLAEAMAEDLAGRFDDDPREIPDENELAARKIAADLEGDEEPT